VTRRRPQTIDRGPGAAAVAVEHKRAAAMVDVGVFDDPALAKIAAFNEFGTDTVPERSFLRSTVDGNARRYAALTNAGIRAAFAGAPADVAYQPLGERVAQDVRNAIVAISNPPNAPSTLEDKRGSNPLVGTGRLHDAIDFRIDGDAS